MGASNHEQLVASQVTEILSNQEKRDVLVEFLHKLRTNYWNDVQLINAVFQPYRGAWLPSLEDALCWQRIWNDITEGKILLTSVFVGHNPKRDKEKEYHQKTLDSHLFDGMHAEVENGCGENDGSFKWKNLRCVEGHTNGWWKRTWKCGIIELEEATCPLEIGYTAGSKTLEHLGYLWGRGRGAVARWPYNSETIWILIHKEHFGSKSSSIIDWTQKQPNEIYGWDAQDCIYGPTTMPNWFAELEKEDSDVALSEGMTIPMIGHYFEDEEEINSLESELTTEHLEATRAKYPSISDSELAFSASILHTLGLLKD